MSKKGVSDVITTVLMILIVLAAIGIVWAVVSSFLNNSTEQIDLGAGFSQIDIVDNSIKYLPSDVLQIKVKRDSNPGNISGLRVIIESSEGNVQSYDIETSVKELETKTIDIQLQGKIQNISKVSIAPRTPIKNKVKTGSTADEQSLGKGVVSNEGLVLYLPFDGDMRDKSGNGNNGTAIHGTHDVADSVRGNVIQFDGSNDYISIPDKISLKYTGGKDLTISIWMNPNAAEVDNGYIISKPWNWCGEYNYDLKYVTATKKISNYFGTISGNTIVLPNTWAHVVLVASSDNFVRTYVNGNLDFSGTNILYTNPNIHVFPPCGNANADEMVSLSIGTLYPYGNYNWSKPDFSFNGTIDEVRIYNRSLSSQEVYYLYKYG